MSIASLIHVVVQIACDSFPFLLLRRNQAGRQPPQALTALLQRFRC